MIFLFDVQLRNKYDDDDDEVKGQRLKSPGRFTQRGLNAQGGCCGQRWNVFGVESTATLRLLGGARGAWAPTGEERGGAILCRHAHSLFRS